MKLKQLLADDDAVSPVIAVILMVAVTVILAAVVGTFVLGLGDRVSEASPNAQFSFEYVDDAAGNSDSVNITHDGGDGIPASQLNVSIDGTTAWDSGAEDTFEIGQEEWNNKVTSGSELQLVEGDDEDVEDGDAVRVIWTASGSDRTAVIGKSEVSL